MAHIACPTCSHTFPAKDSQLDSVVRCPHCKLSLRAGDNIVPEVPFTEVPETDDTESLHTLEHSPHSSNESRSAWDRLSASERTCIGVAAFWFVGVLLIFAFVENSTFRMVLAVPMTFVFFVVGVAIAIANANVNALVAAQTQYRQALDQLKQSPTDPDLRERALALGRQLATVQRSLASPDGIKNGTVTLFDEVALMNDMNAACARATAQSPSSADEVRKFAELRQEGIISKEEFDSVKSRLTGIGAQHIEDTVALLRNLHQLLKQGVLTQGEFNMKKWDVLSKKIIRS